MMRQWFNWVKWLIGFQDLPHAPGEKIMAEWGIGSCLLG